MDRTRSLVLGGDIGGTNTRIVVADATGAVVGRGRAGGGNPVSNPGTAAASLAEAARDALAGLDPAHVEAAVLGMAGGSALADEGVRRSFEVAWTGVGLAWPPVLASDLEIAFASATERPTGRVLIAGTGAVAGRIEDHRLVEVADGIGWLLGDQGAGFWIGSRAVRTVIAEVRRGRGGVLVAGVLAWAGVPAGDSRSTSTALVQAAHRREPVALAGLAPVVLDADRSGDPVAAALLDRAVERLIATLAEVGGAGPVVLAGGLTRPDTPTGARLLVRLGPEAGVRHAEDEVMGAVRLALRTTSGPTRDWI